MLLAIFMKKIEESYKGLICENPGIDSYYHFVCFPSKMTGFTKEVFKIFGIQPILKFQPFLGTNKSFRTDSITATFNPFSIVPRLAFIQALPFEDLKLRNY